MFGDFVDLIYPIELEIKETTDTDRSASYLDLLLEIDSDDQFRTKLCNKRDYLNFPIVNFPFYMKQLTSSTCIWSIYLPSQLIRYSRACASYHDFLDKGVLHCTYKESIEPRVLSG